MTGDWSFSRLPNPPLPPAEVAARVRSCLSGLPYQPEPGPVAMRPVALPRPALESLAAAGSALLRLLRRAVDHLGDSPIERHRALGMDPRLEPLFLDHRFEDAYAGCIARPDVLITASGPKFIEFNVSAGVGAMVHVHLLTRLWKQCYRGAASFLAVDPLAARARMLARACADVGVDRRVLLLGRPADVGAPSARYYEVEVAHLRRQGFRADRCDPSAAAGRVATRRGSGGVLLRRYVPQEWLDSGRELAPLSPVRHPGWWPVSPYGSYLLANKKLLACLSERPGWLSTGEAALIARHIPWTRVVRRGRTDYLGAEHDLESLLMDRQERFVAKHATGNSGRSVHVGCRTPRGDWAAVVARACREGDWVAQEMVQGRRAPVAVVDVRAGRTSERDLPVVISPYFVDGTMTGCQARYHVGAAEPAVIGARSRGVQIGIVVGV